MHKIKNELEDILSELKRVGIDRRRIETDLGYRENYIAQAMSRGGNKKFLTAMRNYRKSVLLNAIPQKAPEETSMVESLKDRIILQLVESNKKLVDNTVDLTQMAKANWTTENASSRNEAYTPIDGQTVLRLLALVASRNKFRDMDEARAFLASELEAMIEEEELAQVGDEAEQQQLRNLGARKNRPATGTLSGTGT